MKHVVIPYHIITDKQIYDPPDTHVTGYMPINRISHNLVIDNFQLTLTVHGRNSCTGGIY